MTSHIERTVSHYATHTDLYRRMGQFKERIVYFIKLGLGLTDNGVMSVIVMD